MPDTLAQRWRAKYPGAYDDLDDAALEKAVLTKFPEYQDLATPAKPQGASPEGVVYDNEPDTFMGGVKNSLLNGEALKAGAQGGLGFLKGAVTDLPSSMFSGLKSVANAALHPIDTITNLPQTISDTGSAMWDTATHAGSDPGAFGEMMGQLTGQPLVTAGLAKGVNLAAPAVSDAMTAAKAPVGRAVEATGKFVSKHTPVTRTVPFVSHGAPFLRDLEGMAGEGIENMGRRMQRNPNPSSAPTEVPKGGVFRDVKPQSKPTPKYEGLYRKSSVPTEAPATPVTDPALSNIPDSLSDIPLDSRLSGLPPEIPSELFPNRGNGPASAAVNRAAATTGPNLVDELTQQARRFGMSIEQYISTLRQGGGEDFVMPSANLPRVR